MAARASELELLPRFAPGCFRKVKRKVNTRYAQTPRLWQASLLASDRCLRFSQRFLRALPGCVRAGRVSSRCRGRSGRPEPGVPGGGRGRPWVFPRRARKRRTRAIRGRCGPSPPRAVWAAPRSRRLRPPVNYRFKSIESYYSETRLLLK